MLEKCFCAQLLPIFVNSVGNVVGCEWENRFIYHSCAGCGATGCDWAQTIVVASHSASCCPIKGYALYKKRAGAGYQSSSKSSGSSSGSCLPSTASSRPCCGPVNPLTGVQDQPKQTPLTSSLCIVNVAGQSDSRTISQCQRPAELENYASARCGRD